MEDLVEILVKSLLGGPCLKIPQMPYIRGAYIKAHVGGSWTALSINILQDPLQLQHVLL